MAKPTERELLDLRLKFQSAYDAYRSCAHALAELGRRGERPDADLLARESAALRELNEARDRYHEALLQMDAES
jgi:hypothetical protein